MIILDTNVLSALMRQTPEQNVITWLDRQPRTSIWITAITVLEVRFGLQIMPSGRRRSLLMQAFEEVLERIGGRVVPFDVAAAQQAGDLMALRHKKGRPGDLRDTLIAGIVIARHAALATRNTAHFEDIPVPLINPWTA
ncbi:MAG TPA: type II toxin-antitoxin system VapC family toxin [Terriglobales bacterium]|nr:type II toxin-antitoxin system VapC family toxin [Terriglobales bacterium]